MKKAFFIAVLIFCLFLFACKKDKTPGISPTVVGKWQIDTSHLTIYDKNGNSLTMSNSSGGNDSITFNKNGTALGIWPFDKNDHVTYVTNNNDGKKNIKLTAVDEYDNSRTVTYEIATLTDHNLELKSTVLPDTTAVQPTYLTSVIDIKLSR